MKDCLFVKKGNASISLLFLLSVITSIFLLLQIRILNLLEWKKADFLLEKIEIQLIPHLKEALSNYAQEEETLEIEGISIQITYGELEAWVDINTPLHHQLHVVYDDVWLCIREFEYLEQQGPY